MRSWLFALVLACAVAGSARAATEIRLWHGMSGAQGAELAALVQQFNDSQTAYRVVPVYQGPAGAALQAALAARRPPALVQVDVVDTGRLLVERRALRPLWQLMRAARVHLAARQFLPGVVSPFLDARGRLLALPLDVSTPVLFYNRAAFRKAGLDPERPPQTWPQMMQALGKIVGSGARCAYTTTSPAWVEVENMSAWHNQAFATRDNGFGGLGARLDFNSLLMMRHVALLESWLKSGYFTYFGRGGRAEQRFAHGECAMLTAASSDILRLRGAAGLDFGVAQLPYYTDDFPHAPQNTLVRGGALWAMAGRPYREYRGVARFLAFLARPQIQAAWHQRTGYLPATLAAYRLSEKQGFYARYPGEQVAIRQLLRRPTRESAGIRLGPLREIGAIIDQELEAVWSDKQTPFDALNQAVARGNRLLRGFQLAHEGRRRTRVTAVTGRYLRAEARRGTAPPD